MKATRSQRTAKAPKRILILDDHPITRYGLTQLISHEPDLLVCGEAESAAQALAAINAARPDLVLADITMPGKSGLEFIKDLQAQYQKTYGPGNYIPPVAVSYWTFRLMVGAGFLMFFIVAYALLQIMRHKPLEQFKLFRYFPLVIALPYLANTCGWLMTELGRQPWVVYGLMKTSDAVSPILSTGTVLASLIGFVLIYGVLMVADVYLLVKYAKAGGEAEGERPVAEQAYCD